MENIDITSQKPIIPSCLHWYNSSNILCNYMREVDYIADSSSRSWELLRAFVTTDEYLNNSSRHKLASS